MYSKKVAVLLLAALVVTAGCLGGGSGDGAEGDGGDGAAGPGDDGSGDAGSDGKSDGDGDAPVNDKDDGDAGSGGDGDAGSGSDGAPGSGGNGVGLVENRTAYLHAAGSYTSVWSTKMTEGGVVVGEQAYTNAVDYVGERSLFGMRVSDDGTVRTDYESYFADGTSYTRYGSGEDATYVTGDGEFAPDDTLFSPTLHASETDLSGYTRVGTETFDGVEVTRYEASQLTDWYGNGYDDEVEWTEFTYVVLVDGDGLVRSEGWSATGVDAEDVAHTIEYSYSLTAIGSTAIDEPDWLAEAESA